MLTLELIALLKESGILFRTAAANTLIEEAVRDTFGTHRDSGQ
jgi:hypothetical protein